VLLVDQVAVEMESLYQLLALQLSMPVVVAVVELAVLAAPVEVAEVELVH
jgi:hypothetical protein